MRTDLVRVSQTVVITDRWQPGDPEYAILFKNAWYRPTTDSIGMPEWETVMPDEGQALSNLPVRGA